MKSEKKAQ